MSMASCLPTLKGDRIVEEFQVILDEYVEKRYGRVLIEA